MIAAAQAAAEAAFREANSRESQSNLSAAAQQQQQSDSGAATTAEAAAQAAAAAALAAAAAGGVGFGGGGLVDELDPHSAAAAVAAAAAAGLDVHAAASGSAAVAAAAGLGDAAAGAADMQSLLQLVTGAGGDADLSSHPDLAAVARAAEQAQLSSRPDVHHITIAQNGTILGVTETVTGFPPNTLLMTSAYDAVYDEDLLGFLAVKTHFWDRGRPEVEAYLRRRTLEGDWLWLVAKVASYIEDPVPGFILVERRVDDEAFALRVNRLTRISAILAQAVEAARLTASASAQSSAAAAAAAVMAGLGPGAGDIAAAAAASGGNGGDPNAAAGRGGGTPDGWVAEDIAAYEAWLQQASKQQQKGGEGNSIDIEQSRDALQHIVNATKDHQGGTHHGSGVTSATSLDQPTMDTITSKNIPKGGGMDGTGGIGSVNVDGDIPNSTGRETFDPLSALKAVRSGICLDMGMIRLFPEEVKLVTLVLTGQMSLDDLGLLVSFTLNSQDKNLSTTLQKYKTDAEKHMIEASDNSNSTTMRHHTGHNDSKYSFPVGSGGSSRGSHHSKKPSDSFSSHLRSNSGSGSNILLAIARNAAAGHHHQHHHHQQQQHQHHHQQEPQQQQQQQMTLESDALMLSSTCVQPPPLSVVNLSYTYMGNLGLEMLCEIIYVDNILLKTIDISFCGIDEKGVLALARAINKRKKKGLPPLRGLVLSGNYISYRAARDLGVALSTSVEKPKVRKRSGRNKTRGTGYDEDNESDDDDFDDDDDGGGIFGGGSAVAAATGAGRGSSSVRSGRSDRSSMGGTGGGDGGRCRKDYGLQVLHIGSASLSSDSLYQLLSGLGQHCPLRELSISSNHIGPSGATLLVDFLEGKGSSKNQPVMPFLDRLDLSNNSLGNDGTAKLTRGISKRIKVNLVDLRLSSNEIGAGGIETIMNKLLQHKLVSLSLDKNAIGDQGCQLVAASLPSMHQLSRLNLSFNQIGSRGVSTLMKTLVGCESITYLGLSGNIMKISGAIAMGFTLAQHPRLEELDLDNCCLSQAAQCHLVAGMISNRWVPMKRMNGFQAGSPMVAIGALDVFAQHLSNEECFRLRRDEQMKTILQWMESNRAAKLNSRNAADAGDMPADSDQNFLTPDFVSSMNDIHGTPSQSAYLRLLGWLSQIPFDEDELTALRKYFYDADGGEGDRGSDGYINLKLRGDLLAALASDVTDEIRDALPSFDEANKDGPTGLDLESIQNALNANTNGNKEEGGSSGTKWLDIYKDLGDEDPLTDDMSSEPLSNNDSSSGIGPNSSANKKRKITSKDALPTHGEEDPCNDDGDDDYAGESEDKGEGELNKEEKKSRNSALKPRITMFPPFETKLEELKVTAQEMMDQEEDPTQQDIILTQYAEASLTILRQLRYHCMDSGLDGWRQGGLRRKVLIVDDSKVTRKMVSRAFEKASFIVDTAENGVEGVQKLKESIYDIVFMDIDMPVMNGFEATKAFRQWEDIMRPGARQPICALTAAYVDDFERSELMKFKEAGLDVMESKPCNIPRLFKVVDDVSPMFSDLSISVTQRESSKLP